jgi:nucleotide-binding universal stress UspA family protein
MAHMETKLILVPTDFSDASTHALRFAARLAERSGARVRLVYADYFVPPIDFAASAAVEYALTSDEAADEAKKLLIRTAEENLPATVKYETRVVIDAPVTAIVDEARHCGADLLVMGTHGRTGFRRLVVGSVTESVMRAINVPVITVSPLTDIDRIAVNLPRIVVPVDYTPECREAIAVAVGLADPKDARVMCVRAVESDTPDIAVGEIKRMQSFTPKELVERCQYKLIPGDRPAEQVVEFAKLVHADLIAVGAPASRTTAEVMRGTFAERVLERSDCPVLVVNEQTVLRAYTNRMEEVAAN